MDEARYYQTRLFEEWFETVDLKNLEDVRWFVSAHALDNCSDVPDSEVFKVAKATVLMYLDDPETAKVFDYYRK